MRKILEHVVEKILKPESAGGQNASDHYSHQQSGGSGGNSATAAHSSGGNSQANQANVSGMSAEELNEAIDAIELTCNDVVSQYLSFHVSMLKWC